MDLDSSGHAFVPAVEPPAVLAGPAWWFAFDGDRLLVRDDGPVSSLPFVADLAELGVTPQDRHYLGTLDGRDCVAAALGADRPLPDGLVLRPLRALYGRLDDALFAVAGRAVQIVAWDLTHRYCSRCAAPTPPLPGERAKKCPTCGLVSYPRLTPAVIVAVRRGDTILLARNAAFTAPFYSVLAGFVEPGESLEGTVRREIREEVGIEVRDIRYFGSQPWPFPHSLMIGFTADWAGGEIRIDERELADAGWFRADALPAIPPKLSIARRLIDAFVAAEAGQGA